MMSELGVKAGLLQQQRDNAETELLAVGAQALKSIDEVKALKAELYQASDGEFGDPDADNEDGYLPDDG